MARPLTSIMKSLIHKVQEGHLKEILGKKKKLLLLFNTISHHFQMIYHLIPSIKISEEKKKYIRFFFVVVCFFNNKGFEDKINKSNIKKKHEGESKK